MIGELLSGLFGGLWGYVATAAGGILVVVLAYLKGGASARAKSRAKAAEDTVKRTEAGRAAAAKAKRSGKTPDEILRGNDEKW